MQPAIARHLLQHSGLYLGYLSYYKVVPEIGMAVILLSNGSSVDINLMAQELTDWLRKNLIWTNMQPVNHCPILQGKYLTTSLSDYVNLELLGDSTGYRLGNDRLIFLNDSVLLVDNNDLTSIKVGKDRHGNPILWLNDNGLVFTFIKTD